MAHRFAEQCGGRLVLTTTAAMLEDLGHTVLQATSGYDALHLLNKHAVALLLTDQRCWK